MVKKRSSSGRWFRILLGLSLLPFAKVALGEAGPAPIEPLEIVLLEQQTFDTLIHDGTRLEFYHRADFLGDRGDCAPCLDPHHVNCPNSCYLTAINLSLICSAQIKGLSLGPFDRASRLRALNDLLLNDEIILATNEGEVALKASRISSQSAGLEGLDNFSLELEGFSDFHKLLERAVTADLERFQMRVGHVVLALPLTAAHRTRFHAFLRQCPED